MVNSINTNIAAYYAQTNISKANTMSAASISRLSSGNRIARASDDVAAMAVGTSLRSTVNALKVGLNNASQGTSMLQVADGALGKIQDMLLRQKALATQATSGSMAASNRAFLNQEFQNLSTEIDRVVQNTNFNGVNLLSGTLGNAAKVVGLDTTAALLTADNGVIASVKAFDAINLNTGATANGTGAGALQFVDGSNTQLVNSGYSSINQSVIGKIGEFKISNIVAGASASISVDINGITFTGNVASGTGAGQFTLTNGNTRIRFGYAAGGVDFTDESTARSAARQLTTSFKDVSIFQTAAVDGVNYQGTKLEGVLGVSNTSAPMLRLSDMSDTSIKNFKYVSSDAAANTNVLSVEIGGKTFYATGVDDQIATGSVITFTDGAQNVMQIKTNGITTAITNIRTSQSDRDGFINALNTAFANIGGGVDFALGVSSSDKLTVSIGKSDTATLYGNQTLDISTQIGAQAAGDVLNDAIDTVTAIRANVGALMSRFDYASANLEIAVQNQDAARGTLLDTDISAESTSYATYQVQLQAGISVLAQANQLGQNFLKLLG